MKNTIVTLIYIFTMCKDRIVLLLVRSNQWIEMQILGHFYDERIHISRTEYVAQTESGELNIYKRLVDYIN